MDDEVRRLERAWRASGLPADEAAWLVARARAGELPRATLERAAVMNHVPARLALDLPLRPVALPLGELRGDALDPVPGDPCVRCWAGVLVDPAPARPLEGDVAPFVTRCPACAVELPGLGSREADEDDPAGAGVIHLRGLPSFEQIARDAEEERLWRESREEDELARRGHDRPALRPEPTLWQRLRALLGGAGP